MSWWSRPLGLLAIVILMAPVQGQADDGAVSQRAALATDVAPQVGLDFVHSDFYAGVGKGRFAFYEATAGGVCWGDYDNDGHPDALFTDFPGPEHSGSTRLYRNLGPDANYSFVDVTSELGVGVQGVGQGCAWGDYDNDGWLDLYLTFVVTPFSPQPNVLLRNLAGKGFEDVSERAGVTGPSRGSSQPCGPTISVEEAGRGPEHLERCWSTGAAWLDYDNDGDLDLYVAQYARFPAGSCIMEYGGIPIFCQGQPNRLYRNDGGVFTDVASFAGVADNGQSTGGRSLAVLATDVNGDGWVDIYVANDMDANALYLNGRDGTFENVASAWGLDNHGQRSDGTMGHRAGMGVEVDDLDGDGRLDFLSTHLRGEYDALYMGQGGSWVDRSEAMGLEPVAEDASRWGGAFVDVDVDGDKDLIVVAGGQVPADRGPAHLLVQQGGTLVYQDNSWPYAQEGRANYRGVALADYNDDGAPDVLLGVLPNWEGLPASARLLSFAAPQPTANWLHVHLEGTDSNRDAMGAIVTVQADLNGTSRTFVEHLHGGGHYLGNNEKRLLFGLGQSIPVEVHVAWPGGGESWHSVAPDQRSVIVVEPNRRPPTPVGWVRSLQENNGLHVEWEQSLATDFAAYRLIWPGGSKDITNRSVTSVTLVAKGPVELRVLDQASMESLPVTDQPQSQQAPVGWPLAVVAAAAAWHRTRALRSGQLCTQRVSCNAGDS